LRCLVLGGCGFLGSHLVDGLLDSDYEVAVFDKVNVDTKNIEHSLTKVDLIKGDFANRNDLERAIKGVDCVFHFIGTTLPESSTQNPVYDIETNVISSISLLEFAKSANVKKVIFASSGGTIYGIPRKIPIPEGHPTNPICAYGISKLMIEKYLHLYFNLYGLDYVSLRFSNAYGERQDPNSSQGAVAVFLGKIIKGDPIDIWGDGEVVRDYIYVKDIVDACLKAAELKQTKCHTFNIGSGNGVSLNSLIQIIKNVTGKDVKVKYTKGRKIDVPTNVLDVSLARKVLGWEPRIGIEAGIKRVLSDFRLEG
jgi:UDP-glucose 4-epimerase